ncbi:MAG: hypothetical protein H0W58_02935 [Acidobacteria bacterium]|jgi:hypothetical protein|nr:hypothetical protein [Acidobacteriota bacterium]
MFKKIQIKNLAWLILSAFALFNLACQQPVANNNANTTNVNVNINTNFNANVSNANISNANMANETGVIVDTKEPEQYQATVSLRLETSGDQKLTMPPLKAEVARNGVNRRMEITAPNGEKIVYLETNGKNLIIAPQRKQYGELSKESLGFEVQNLMMPGQIVNRIKNMKGVEKVGEEKVDGRDAIKYRYSATTNTQTKAGNVETESYILVDKETGLPLRSFTNSQSQSGNVQGISGLSLVTEMSNIRTTADESLFAAPTDYKQVEPEQIRQQVNQLLSVAMAIIGQVMQSAQPAATPTP